MTARQDLELARALEHSPSAALEGCWARASAIVARQALEASIESFWQAVEPGLSGATMRTQFAYLPFELGDVALAREAHWTWTRLSRVVHHHVYELPPTTMELAGLLDSVERVIDGVDQRVPQLYAEAIARTRRPVSA